MMDHSYGSRPLPIVENRQKRETLDHSYVSRQINADESTQLLPQDSPQKHAELGTGRQRGRPRSISECGTRVGDMGAEISNRLATTLITPSRSSNAHDSRYIKSAERPKKSRHSSGKSYSSSRVGRSPYSDIGGRKRNFTDSESSAEDAVDNTEIANKSKIPAPLPDIMHDWEIIVKSLKANERQEKRHDPNQVIKTEETQRLKSCRLEYQKDECESKKEEQVKEVSANLNPGDRIQSNEERLIESSTISEKILESSSSSSSSKENSHLSTQRSKELSSEVLNSNENSLKKSGEISVTSEKDSIKKVRKKSGENSVTSEKDSIKRVRKKSSENKSERKSSEKIEENIDKTSLQTTNDWVKEALESIKQVKPKNLSVIDNNEAYNSYSENDDDLNGNNMKRNKRPLVDEKIVLNESVMRETNITKNKLQLEDSNDTKTCHRKDISDHSAKELDHKINVHKTSYSNSSDNFDNKNSIDDNSIPEDTELSEKMEIDEETITKKELTDASNEINKKSLDIGLDEIRVKSFDVNTTSVNRNVKRKPLKTVYIDCRDSLRMKM